jgi:hypothetical protein
MNKYSSYNTKQLIKLFIVCYALNFVWISGTSILNGVTSLQGFVSSLRLLVSSIVVAILYKHISVEGLLRTLYALALVNSSIVILQLINSLFNFYTLPSWGTYGYFYNFDDIEVWRKGGIFGSLQTSSAISFAALVYGALKRKLIYILQFPILIIPVLFGARTSIMLLPFLFVFLVFSRHKLVLIWLPIIYFIFNDIRGFESFIELRYGNLSNLVFKFDLRSDYSLVDTLRYYRDPTPWEFIFGNGHFRYSEYGGGDPFYTRWLLQSGALSLLLVLLPTLVACFYIAQSSILYIIPFLVFYINNFKGELFTSWVVFDFCLLLMMSFLHSNRIRH